MLIGFPERSPFQVHKTVYRAFYECKRYFKELLEVKKKQLYLGESDKGISKYCFSNTFNSTD